MTLFAEILRGCGLSQKEAADFLDARIDTVKSWGSGRNAVPAGVLNEMHALTEKQEAAATQAQQIWLDAGEPDEIEIGISSDDYEARSLGWPCVGAHGAVIRRLWEMLPTDVDIVVVPRGSTSASAAAADMVDRSSPSAGKHRRKQ